jgi:hypothetical protein
MYLRIRPLLWDLYVGGETGAKKVLDIFRDSWILQYNGLVWVRMYVCTTKAFIGKIS